MMYSDQLRDTIRLVAPGTPLREAIDNILRAQTGGLIVIGEAAVEMGLVSGGFKVDVPFSSAMVYEMAKMDGAIILRGDASRVLFCNVHLVPDRSLLSTETGIRHRVATLIARQSGDAVVAISQRRSVITLYRGPHKYVLQDTNVVQARANQALQTLERYNAALDRALGDLTEAEIERRATLEHVGTALSRAEMVRRVAREVEGYTVELGAEGRLVRMQLAELDGDRDVRDLIVRDYCRAAGDRAVERCLISMAELDTGELVSTVPFARLLGAGAAALPDTVLTPRGLRLLRQIPRLPAEVAANIVEVFGDLSSILKADADELDEVEGVGEARARAVVDGLSRLGRAAAHAGDGHRAATPHH
jgi:diadenylate cyclase